MSNSPTILLGSAIAFNRSCKQVYRMWDGMSAFKPSPVIKSDKLSYCCKQCSMTLLCKASALHVSCNIRMGLGRDPLSLSTCRVGSRSTTTLLKKHLPSGFVLYTELRSLVVVRLQRLEQGSVKRLYFVCSMRRQTKHYYVLLSCQLNGLQVLHMSALSIQHKKDLFVCSSWTKSIKCCSHSVKVSASIQPLSLQVTTLPIGAPLLSSAGILFRLKITSGGTYCPAALLQHTTVVLIPCSALDIDPIWCLPVRPITFWQDFCTTEMPDVLVHVMDARGSQLAFVNYFLE